MQGRHACTECDKSFLSLKAFGHMRSHPDRTWRGIIPPCDHPHFQNSNLEPDGVSASTSNSIDDELEVASAMLMLANNNRFQCSCCKKVFCSHQALGGHRASHKNVKGCFAITHGVVSLAKEEPRNVHKNVKGSVPDLNLSPTSDETM